MENASYAGTQIREVIVTLGVRDRVLELPAGEAAEIREQIVAKFFKPGLEWWWERMKSGVVFWMNGPDWRPLKFLPEICPDGVVWFFPVYDDNGEVFQGPRDLVMKVLAKSAPSEYAIAATGLGWIVIVNHHDGVYGAGEPIVARLLEKLKQPEAQGEAFDKPAV